MLQVHEVLWIDLKSNMIHISKVDPWWMLIHLINFKVFEHIQHIYFNEEIFWQPEGILIWHALDETWQENNMVVTIFLVQF